MKDWMKNIPNIISGLRIALVFVFEIFFIKSMYIEGLIVYSLAFVSDIVDGYLARKYNWISNVGKLLDPFADKLMLITALVGLTVRGFIPLWIMILMGTKELIMCIVGIVFYKHGTVVEANVTGKISTGAWAAAIILNILAAIHPVLTLPANILTVAAAVLAVIAGVSYIVIYFYKKDKEKA